MSDFATLIAFVSGLATAGLIHLLAVQRDREARANSEMLARRDRISELLAFLARWRSETDRIDPRKFDDLWNHYVPCACAIGERAARLHYEFVDSGRFHNLASSLGGIGYPALQSYKGDPRDMIKAEIDALADFVRKEAQPVTRAQRA